MLTKTDTAASIVVCSTCRLNDEAREDETGKRGGALFAEAVREAAARRGNIDIHIDETACFFACSRYCRRFPRYGYRCCRAALQPHAQPPQRAHRRVCPSHPRGPRHSVGM
ncbi:MAG: DUF1636 family protein [Pseudomonadota bacterium]